MLLGFLARKTRQMSMTMRGIHRGEGWLVDFGLAAKVRPALLLTDEPADDELDLVTAVLHRTALCGNRWEVSVPKPFLKPGTFQLQRRLHRTRGSSSGLYLYGTPTGHRS